MKRLVASMLTLVLMLPAAAEDAAVQEPENLFTGGKASFSGDGSLNSNATKANGAPSFTGNAQINYLFDNNAASHTSIAMSSITSPQINIDYMFSGEPVKANAYTIQAGPANSDGVKELWNAEGRAPQAFSFWGYDKEKGEWEKLDPNENDSIWRASSGWKKGEVRNFQFVNSKAYSGYRLTIKGSKGGVMGFSELKLHWIDTSNVLAVESNKENFGVPYPQYGVKDDMTLGEEVTCEASCISVGAEGLISANSDANSPRHAEGCLHREAST